MGDIDAGPVSVEVERKSNNFDFLRVLAAFLVIVGHSYGVTGHRNQDIIDVITNHQLFSGTVGVIIFFIISGYLVAKSWDRSKDLARFLWARALRIFPGLICVVLFCILVIGPLVTSLPLRDYFFNGDTWKYLATISVFLAPMNVLPGVFADNPEMMMVNGNLWTLAFEFRMYLFLALAGIIGLFYKRWVLLCATMLSIFIYLYNYSSSYVIFGLVYNVFSVLGLVSFLSPVATPGGAASIFLIAFMMGTILYLYRDLVRYPAAGLAAALLLWAGSLFVGGWVLSLTTLTLLPYGVIGLAYIKIPLAHTVTKYGDFSYGLYIYGYVLQQTIVYYLGTIPVPEMLVLSLVVVTPFAVVSWHLVEKRALRLKNIDVSGFVRGMLKIPRMA